MNKKDLLEVLQSLEDKIWDSEAYVRNALELVQRANEDLRMASDQIGHLRRTLLLEEDE